MPIEIIHISEETPEWVEPADAAFRVAGLRPTGRKELGLAAVRQGTVLGATYHSFSHPTAWDGEEVFPGDIYDFDLGVDPRHQGGVVGYLLLEASLKLARECECSVIDLLVVNPVMAKMLFSKGFV